MLWPLTQGKVYNAAHAMKYSLPVALALKRLDTFVTARKICKYIIFNGIIKM